MFEKTKNKVARILKGYAVINAVVVILASAVIASNEGEALIFIIGAAVGICVNFAIFAGGELIDLLAQIRDNTRPNGAAEDLDFEDQLPDL